MKKFLPSFAILFFMLPSVSFASGLTTQQANSLIVVVQSSPGTPASAFVNLITAFSNITVNQATSLITVVQSSPGTAANAFVSLLISFTTDTPVSVSTQPQSQSVTPVTASTPPPNTTFCNGSYWNKCPSGQDFVCPQTGNAYCQLNASVVDQQQQQKQAQIDAITQSCNTQRNQINQQIIDLKNSYYKQLPGILSSGTSVVAQGNANLLLNQTNQKIAQLDLQIQQIQLDCQSKISALQ